jgi:hypothetical protein
VRAANGPWDCPASPTIAEEDRTATAPLLHRYCEPVSRAATTDAHPENYGANTAYLAPGGKTGKA